MIALFPQFSIKVINTILWIIIIEEFLFAQFTWPVFAVLKYSLATLLYFSFVLTLCTFISTTLWSCIVYHSLQKQNLKKSPKRNKTNRLTDKLLTTKTKQQHNQWYIMVRVVSCYWFIWYRMLIFPQCEWLTVLLLFVIALKFCIEFVNYTLYVRMLFSLQSNKITLDRR